MKTSVLVIAISIAGAMLGSAPVEHASHVAYSQPMPPVAPSGGVSFDSVTIPVGEEPGPVVIADVNHDGKMDILVANTKSETLTVLLGDGKGHFTPAPGKACATGKGPNDIALGDFNGDGNIDLAIANTGTPYITILLGDGKGGFAPSPGSPFATESHPHVHGAVAADFSGDGKLDVITDSWGHNQILMMRGDGRGNLMGPGKLFNVGKRPYQRLRSADFNKDGKPDIVTTDLDQDTVTILLGDGKGGFREASGSPFPAGPAPWEVAIDDLNKDGNLDLVTVPYAPDVKDPQRVGVTILYGDGKGGFTPTHGGPLTLAGCEGPDRVATGDFNGDGYRDIVVSCGQGETLMVYAGTKDGGYQVSKHEVKKLGWSCIAVADLNGDGKDDIVVSNNQGNTITILFAK